MQSKLQNNYHRSKTFITKHHIWIITSIIITLFAGISLAFGPEKFRYIMLLIIPATIICILILRNPYYGIYLFFFYSYLRPYDFIPALRVLKLTMLIEIVTLVAWLIKLATTKSNIKWSAFSWYYLGFIGVIGITVIIAVNNFYAYQAFLNMATLFVMFILAANIVDSSKRLNQIVWLLLIIHLYFALQGIKTFMTGAHLVGNQYTSGQVGSGYIGDENDFALIINMMIPFAFFGIFYFKEKVKLVCTGLLLVFVFGVISSFSRGGLIGLACLLLYCILSSKKKLLSFAVVISIFLAMFMFAPSSYWDEAKTIQDIDQGTADTRIRYWKAGFRMFRDHPIVGVGADNGGVHMPMYIQGSGDPNTQWGRAFHGTIPQIVAELGTLGSFFYFAMIIIAFKLLYRIKKRKVGEGGDDFSQYMANSIIGSLIAYFACATFLSTAYYPHLWTLYTLTFILAYSSESKRVEQPGIETSLKKNGDSLTNNR